MNKFFLFSKETCGPCGLVNRYINSLKDERLDIIEKVDLDDFSDTPIPQENIDLAKKYGVTATPVLVITDENGEKLEQFIGGLPITQNIRKMLDQYYNA